MLLISIIICFGASVIGAICGIGGGIIIKPMLDAFSGIDIGVINFLSGCTVLSMSIYSVIKIRISDTNALNFSITIPLSIGSVVGGIIGNSLFEVTNLYVNNSAFIRLIQNVVLFILTLSSLWYTLNMHKIKTYQIHNIIYSVCIGFILGTISSFLGIGGGPINLIILYYFYTMKTKEAAQNSLCIILFSQTASLITSLYQNDVFEIDIYFVICMVMCGILGGIIGRSINKHISDKIAHNLLIYAMVIILMINMYNILKIWI